MNKQSNYHRFITLPTHRLVFWINLNLSWLRNKQSLLTKYHSTSRHLQTALLQLPPGWSQVQVRRDPFWILAPSLLTSQIQSQNDLSCPQPRVVNTSRFRVVFTPDRSPGLEENYPLVDHTHIYQIVFSTEQPNGASSLSSYPGQTSCLSCLNFVTGSCGKLQYLCTGNMIHRAAVKDLWISPAVDRSCLHQVKFNKQLYHILHSVPRVAKNNV